jgi:hypothetical protein
MNGDVAYRQYYAKALTANNVSELVGESDIGDSGQG